MLLGSLRTPFLKHLSHSIRTPVFPFSLSAPKCINTNSSLSTPPYFSVQISCPKHISDTFSEALLCFGATSVTIDEQDNNAEICITSIFTESEDVPTCISHAADSIGLKLVPSYKLIRGDNYEWMQKTQESFHPVEVTKGFWIVPEWTEPPDPQATNIILNPGLTFGTGDHSTTKLCLMLLHGLIKGGEIFLDYGTGSGILGIAALKLGASLSVGVDIDPISITSARQNAALNNIEPEKMQVFLVPSETRSSANLTESRDEAHHMNVITQKYDIVIANILLNPLLELADHIVDFAKPGGIVGLSGILSEQLPQIEEQYSKFLDSISVTELDGWVCVSGTKRRNINPTKTILHD